MSVVVVCLDSVRADHVGAYRADRHRPGNQVATPSFDAFARESLRFTHARPEQLPTGPTRRSIHTGIRTFPADRWHPDPDSPRIYGWQHIPSAQATLAELFGAAGYRTAMVTDNTWMLKPSWAPFSRTWGDFVGIHGQVQQSLPKGRSIDRVDVSRYLPDGLRGLSGKKAQTNEEVIARYVVNRGHRDREEDWFARASSAPRRGGSSATPRRRSPSSSSSTPRPPRAVGPAAQVRRALRRPRPAREGLDLPGLRPRRLPDAARDRAHEGALRGRADDGRPLAAARSSSASTSCG